MPIQKMIPLDDMPIPPNRLVDSPTIFSQKAQATVDAQEKMVKQFNSGIIPQFNTVVEPVNSVLTNMPNISTVANMATSVTRVAASADNIDRIQTDIPNINIVAGISSDVTRVAQSANSIDRIQINLGAIITTATNIADVVIASNNIDAVIAAPTYAVEAKYWAEQAKDIVGIGPATETESGIIRIATSEEVKLGESNVLAITPATLRDEIKGLGGATSAMNMAETYYLANTGGF